MVSPSANCCTNRLLMSVVRSPQSIVRSWRKPIIICHCTMIGVSWLRTTDYGLRTMDKKLLAFDLGAESGRGELGLFDGQRMKLEVIHRFANGPVRTLDTLHWDVLRLYSEMLSALCVCAAQHGGIDSLGVDTWGV